jgi:hypothetical protein
VTYSLNCHDEINIDVDAGLGSSVGCTGLLLGPSKRAERGSPSARTLSDFETVATGSEPLPSGAELELETWALLRVGRRRRRQNRETKPPIRTSPTVGTSFH